jgi:hypothetical protein
MRYRIDDPVSLDKRLMAISSAEWSLPGTEPSADGRHAVRPVEYLKKHLPTVLQSFHRPSSVERSSDSIGKPKAVEPCLRHADRLMMTGDANFVAVITARLRKTEGSPPGLGVDQFGKLASTSAHFPSR